ncbi:MAG: crotonase/enoyl-CoA hydratase family protein [Geminicoccaceae bacterium]|nr:crotonase/enoyl-CoA hydratase family protein [Geminicoccaceae bacterium]MCX8101152.1 crotonase/enoyl-CoA hydratase family protein [Geminicoccaceae bacterium]MDW8370132.1 crotonase/enoyl-CoA hydratase family protein [Geminicoccaceae bacterium]
MAVSTRSLHALLARTDNDNLPVRGFLDGRPTVLPFPSRHKTLDLDYPHLATRFEPETGILWARMKHRERACYTPEIMRDMRDFQLHLRDLYAGASLDDCPIRWLVWSSDAPKAWSLGGDLQTFTRMIRAGDEAGLRAYAHLAIDILHDNLICMDLPILTVALVTGDAIGGGFEAMLTDDLVIAERGAKFGLPEILFNLFPGMGAYSFLKRKVGPGLARELIEDGLTRSAEEMKELGLVDIVCEPGEAAATLRAHVADQAARFRTLKTLRQVRQRVDPVSKRELVDVVDLWVDLAMRLSDADLRRMDCLARVQERKRTPV